MADHPRTSGRKALRTTPGFLYRARRPTRAAAATGCMRGLEFTECFRGAGAALVGGMGLAPLRGHAEEIRRRQHGAGRGARAFRATLRRVAFRHRPHVGKRAAIVADIVVDRHFISLRVEDQNSDDRGCGAANLEAVPASRRAGRTYLSGDSGIWMSPLMCLIGPTDDGMMSKSKISVGNHSVAQAFGTSTTPEIWPWQGAVPRIE
jgi:hypothetical protein